MIQKYCPKVYKKGCHLGPMKEPFMWNLFSSTRRKAWKNYIARKSTKFGQREKSLFKEQMLMMQRVTDNRLHTTISATEAGSNLPRSLVHRFANEHIANARSTFWYMIIKSCRKKKFNDFQHVFQKLAALKFIVANKVTFKIEEHEIGPDNQLQDLTSKRKHLQKSARMYVVLTKIQSTAQLSLHVNSILATLASYIKELNMAVSSPGSSKGRPSVNRDLSCYEAFYSGWK